MHWQPTVLHPKLKDGQAIVTGEADIPPLHTVDRDGNAITAEEHPALTGVLTDLRKRYAGKAGGTPGVETRIVDAKGEDTGTTLATLSEGTAGTLKTTLDMAAQRAAEQAIAKKPKAGVVAVRPSTGEILAVAHTPAKGFDTALQGSYAPGSTMKVITSTLLMEKGLASPGDRHPCPSTSPTGTGSSTTTTTSRSRTAPSRGASPRPATPPSSARRPNSRTTR